MKKDFLHGLLFIGLNIVAAILVVTLILWGLSAHLRNYTQHGIEEQVPDIKGMVVEEAQRVLRDS